MPPVAILCLTGSELTRGETVDLNGSFLAANLTSLGIRVLEVVLLPDDAALMAKVLERAISTYDLVVTSGGLGPTRDDLTVEVLAGVLGRGILRDAVAEAAMRRRARTRGIREEDLPPNYWKQAHVVDGARVFQNPVGLAPGMLIEAAHGIVLVLPGVPRELRALFREHVAPALRTIFRLVPPKILRGKILGIPESLAEARVQSLGIDFERVEYGISAKPGEILVKFVVHDPSHFALAEEIGRLLAQEFGDDFLRLEDDLVDPGGQPRGTEFARIVHERLIDSKVTVATAESCTGGLIAKMLTDHAGSSAYFLGSVVAYHDDAKSLLLGIPRGLIRAHGAVSEEVCGAMARAARDRFGADYGLATTGIAGPSGGTPEKPVGLTYVGLAGAGAREGHDLAVVRCQFWGDRDVNRTLSAVRSLDLLRRALMRGRR